MCVFVFQAIPYRWIFRTHIYPNQTHPHLRANQQLLDHQPGRTLLRPSIPRKVSQTKLQLMELSRLRKPSLQHTTDSHQSRTQALPGHLNASLKVQSSTIIFCQVKLYINLHSHPTSLYESAVSTDSFRVLLNLILTSSLSCCPDSQNHYSLIHNRRLF